MSVPEAKLQTLRIVTGSNKGIGYHIVHGLCRDFKGDVILTARSQQLGEQAVNTLKAEGLKPVFHLLDISDASSIDKLREFLKTTYGGLDVLVNNAAIAFKSTAVEPFDVQAEESMKVNFWGTVNVCDALFPLLRPHARVVHLGSFVSGWTARKCSEALNVRFLDPNLDIDTTKQLMTEFVEATKKGDHIAKGWPDMAYGMTKVGVYLLTVAQQKKFDKDAREDLIVNCCCPGYVQTDMTGKSGLLTAEQGAENPLYAALLPENCPGPKGKFLSKKTVWEWPGTIGSEEYMR